MSTEQNPAQIPLEAIQSLQHHVRQAVQEAEHTQSPSLHLQEAYEALGNGEAIGQIQEAVTTHFAHPRLQTLEQIITKEATTTTSLQGSDRKVAFWRIGKELDQTTIPHPRRKEIREGDPVTITAEELMTIANYAKRDNLGYYIAGPGVGREAAFTTPLAEDEAYGQTYSKIVRHAYEKVKNTIGQEKFVIFIAGDAEGVLFEAVMQELFGNDSPVDPETIEFVVLDRSDTLLAKQQDIQDRLAVSNVQISSAFHDARHIGTLLAKYPKRKGILLGEELLDAYPSQIIKLDDAGNLVEKVYFVSSDGKYETGWQNVTSSDAKGIQALLSVFPYYDTYLASGREIPINWGAMQMIFDLDASSCDLYMAFGDYTNTWNILPHLISSKAFPLAARGYAYPPTSLTNPPYLEDALKRLADTTTDVDFALFALAKHIAVDTLDRAALVMEQVHTGRTRTFEQYQEDVLRRTDALTPENADDETLHFLYVLQKEGYLDRSMMVGRSKNLPTL